MVLLVAVVSLYFVENQSAAVIQSIESLQNALGFDDVVDLEGYF